MTDVVLDYGKLFDEDLESPSFKHEAIALRLSHMIAEAMSECGLTRTDLAHRLGVSPPMVTKILSGTSNFTLKTLVNLADVLDYDFDPGFCPKGYDVAMEYLLPQSQMLLTAANMAASAVLTQVAAPSPTVGASWDVSTCGDEPWLKAVA